MDASDRESQDQLIDRLTREGRLESFQARFRELKQQGIDQPWRAAKREFPPMQQPPAVEGESADLIDAAMFEGKSCSEEAAIRWVADNLTVAVHPSDCPSSQAWGLLSWARDNESDFFKVIYTKILPNKSGQVGGGNSELEPSPPEKLLERLQSYRS